MDEITLKSLAEEARGAATWLRGDNGSPTTFNQELAAINFGVGVVKQRRQLSLEQVLELLQKLEDDRQAGIAAEAKEEWVAGLIKNAVTPN